MKTIKLSDLKVGLRVSRPSRDYQNGNPFLKITKISKYNIFVKPTNYPASAFKVPISEFLKKYEIDTFRNR